MQTNPEDELPKPKCKHTTDGIVHSHKGPDEGAISIKAALSCHLIDSRIFTQTRFAVLNEVVNTTQSHAVPLNWPVFLSVL